MRWISSALLFAVVACHPAGIGTEPRPEPRNLLVLVGLDGFRPDYLDRPGAVALRRLRAQGTTTPRLIPSFPSKTFPNLYTIATGLYPENHGIVGHTMVDRAIGRFTLADTVTNRDPRWWRGEPIWITAVKQGRRAATMFWPGSEVPFDGGRATYWHSFDAGIPNAERVDRVLAWLGLPPERAPSFVTLYTEQVDVAGHRFGPDSPELDRAIAQVDSAVGRLVDGLDSLGILARANLVLVADHGMTAIDPGRVIFLDDYVTLQPGDVVDLAPVTTLDPGRARVEEVYAKLAHAHPRLAVYRRSETPDPFRFRADPRISPLVLVADDGWTISIRNQGRGVPLSDRGNHGYDPMLASMAALFIAVGPAFPSGVVVPPFRNIHLYPLMTRLLGLVPAPNDGNLDSVRALLR